MPTGEMENRIQLWPTCFTAHKKFIKLLFEETILIPHCQYTQQAHSVRPMNYSPPSLHN